MSELNIICVDYFQLANKKIIQFKLYEIYSCLSENNMIFREIEIENNTYTEKLFLLLDYKSLS